MLDEQIIYQSHLNQLQSVPMSTGQHLRTTFAIPLPQEVINLIATFLSKTDLNICAQVCKDWNCSFGPCLWETIEIRNDQLFFRFAASVKEGSLARNGRYIRNLSTTFFSIVDLLVSCDDIKLVDLHVHSEHDPPETMPPSTTSASVSTEGKFQNEPNVFAKRAPRQKTPDLTNLIRFIQKNSTLRKLSLYGGMFWQQKLSSISRLFKAIPETVEDLDIAARYGQPPKESEELTAELNEDDNEGAQLNINQIKFQHTMLDERVLVPLLKRCPRLKTIVLNVHLSRSLSQEFFSVLRGHCPQLKELRVMKNLGRFCSDSDISYLLGSTTNGWKSIYLTFLPTFGSLSEAALLKNAPSLEVLQTATCPRFTSPLIQKILCTAPNLIRLDLLDRLHSPNPLGLKAQDIIQSKWVCDKLEVLRVRITGIPRPDLRIHYNNPPLKKPIHEGQIEDSFLIQRKVYSQLGAMIHLKELILGLVYDGDFQSRESERYWTDRGWRQNECLSFTLRSGMGQLQHLKSLERIHLHGMTVGFNGAAEQLWVKDNWPALKYMYGDWNKYDRTLWERDVYFNGLK